MSSIEAIEAGGPSQEDSSKRKDQVDDDLLDPFARRTPKVGNLYGFADELSVQEIDTGSRKASTIGDGSSSE